MNKNIAKRLRNILKGDVNASTKTIIGYKQVSEEHNEGDIWEENGKKWTIKNGIKQNIVKFNKSKMPVNCPKCGKLLRGYHNEKAYTNNKTCLDCMVEEDGQLIIEGKFKEKEDQLINASLKSFVEDIKLVATEYINDSPQFVTEQGDIEEWSNGHTAEKFEEILNTQIHEIEQTINS